MVRHPLPVISLKPTRGRQKFVRKLTLIPSHTCQQSAALKQRAATRLAENENIGLAAVTCAEKSVGNQVTLSAIWSITSAKNHSNARLVYCEPQDQKLDHCHGNHSVERVISMILSPRF